MIKVLAWSPSAAVEEEPTASRAALVPRVGGVTGQERPTFLKAQLLYICPMSSLCSTPQGRAAI